MVLWLKQERKMRETTHPTPDMDAQIHHFMFHHYCNWFSMDHVSEVFACVPQVSLVNPLTLGVFSSADHRAIARRLVNPLHPLQFLART